MEFHAFNFRNCRVLLFKTMCFNIWNNIICKSSPAMTSMLWHISNLKEGKKIHIFISSTWRLHNELHGNGRGQQNYTK